VVSQFAGRVAIGCCTWGVYLRAGIGSEGFASDDGKMNGKSGERVKDPARKRRRVGYAKFKMRCGLRPGRASPR